MEVKVGVGRSLTPSRLIIFINILLLGLAGALINERLSYALNLRIPEISPYPPLDSWGGDLFLAVDHFNRFGFNEVWYSNSYLLGSAVFSQALLVIVKAFGSMYIAGVSYFLLCLGLLFYIARTRIVDVQNCLLFTLSVGFVSYPGFLLFHTLNYDFLVILLLFLSFDLLILEKRRWAIAIIAFITLIKLWPILFSSLLFRGRGFGEKIKSAIEILGFLIIEFVVLFAIFGSSVDHSIAQYFNNFSASVKLYEELMVLSPSSLNYTSSLLNLFENLHLRINDSFFPLNGYISKIKLGFIAALAFSFLIVAFDVIKKTSDAMLVLICSCILFFPTTGDYKLLLFVYSILNLLGSNRHIYMFFLIAFLLLPKPYFPKGYTNVGSLLNPIIVLLIYLIACCDQLRIIFINKNWKKWLA